VLSSGFDIYREDPQAKIAVESEDIETLGRRIASMDLPTLVIQEGGYHYDSLTLNTEHLIRGLSAG